MTTIHLKTTKHSHAEDAALFNHGKVDQQKDGEHNKAFYNFGSYYHGSTNDWRIASQLKGLVESSSIKNSDGAHDDENDGSLPEESKKSTLTSKVVATTAATRRRDSNQTAQTVSMSLCSNDEDDGSILQACHDELEPTSKTSSRRKEFSSETKNKRTKKPNKSTTKSTKDVIPPLEIHLHDVHEDDEGYLSLLDQTEEPLSNHKQSIHGVPAKEPSSFHDSTSKNSDKPKKRDKSSPRKHPSSPHEKSTKKKQNSGSKENDEGSSHHKKKRSSKTCDKDKSSGREHGRSNKCSDSDMLESPTPKHKSRSKSCTRSKSRTRSKSCNRDETRRHKHKDSSSSRGKQEKSSRHKHKTQTGEKLRRSHRNTNKTASLSHPDPENSLRSTRSMPQSYDPAECHNSNALGRSLQQNEDSVRSTRSVPLRYASPRRGSIRAAELMRQKLSARDYGTPSSRKDPNNEDDDDLSAYSGHSVTKRKLNISMKSKDASRFFSTLLIPPPSPKVEHRKKTKDKSYMASEQHLDNTSSHDGNPATTTTTSSAATSVICKPKQRPFPLTDAEQVLMRRKCYTLYLRWGEPDRERMKQLLEEMPADENPDLYVQDIDLLPWKCHGTQLSVKAMREK